MRSIRDKINYIKEEFLDFNILCFTETHLNDPITQGNLFLSQAFAGGSTLQEGQN